MFCFSVLPVLIAHRKNTEYICFSEKTSYLCCKFRRIVFVIKAIAYYFALTEKT